MAKAEEKYSGSKGWYELSKDMREEILALLPLEWLCRCRSVCKEWNALLSSTKFITITWAEAPPNKRPWLFLCKNFYTYCFFTGKWKNSPFSFSFLSRADEKVKYGDFYYLFGSAQGLFLVGTTCWYDKLTVCNPLNQTFLKLPPMSSIKKVVAIGIVASNVGDQETYKVVAVGLSHRESVESDVMTVDRNRSCINSQAYIVCSGLDYKSHLQNQMTVDIYDSYEKKWRIAGHLPENMDRIWNIVFCNGFFYCTTLDRAVGMGVLGFSMGEGTSIFTPLPELPNGHRMYPKLLTYGSRILLAGGVYQKRGPYAKKTIELILWEFQRDSESSCWKEISRMPPSMCEFFQRNSYFDSFECVGVGDGMCFTSCQFSNDVAVYNLSERTWGWLPTAPTVLGGYPRVIAFTPRPDLKVG